jgi:hypothetical protein
MRLSSTVLEDFEHEPDQKPQRCPAASRDVTTLRMTSQYTFQPSRDVHNRTDAGCRILEPHAHLTAVVRV